MALALLGLLGGAAPALAAPCKFVTKYWAGGFAVANFDMGAVNLNQNYPAGAVIASQQSSYNTIAPRMAFTCGINARMTNNFLMSGAGPSGTYPTNIAGVGVRVSVWATSSYFSTPQTATVTPTSWNFTMNTENGYDTYYLQVKVELVATGGPISGGANLSYQANPWFTTKDNVGGALDLTALQVTATLIPKTCSVTQTNVAVNLPEVKTSDLPSTGASAGSTPFSLDLNCAAGIPVAATLTDAANPANRSNQLSLASGSTATGVALQVLKDSTVLSYGPDSDATNNPNRWSAGTAAGGAMSIPLTARYVRTAGALSPGLVKGAATFTMSYQ